jgi:hypothetical protein
MVDLFNQAAKRLALQDAAPHSLNADVALAILSQSPLVNVAITRSQTE